MFVSKYLRQTPPQSGSALVYHSLRGNMFLLKPEYMEVIRLLRENPDSSLTRQQKRIVAKLTTEGFLTDDNGNERDYLRQRNNEWMEKVSGGGQLRQLNLMISEACNFGCKHCLHKCSVDATPTHGKKKIMDLETATHAFDLYYSMTRSQGDFPLHVHFGSAEPLLNWVVLRDTIGYIHHKESEIGIAVNTNLSLLTREMAIFFKEHSVNISTSLDGPMEGNDAIRTYQSGQGTYHDILSKFRLLKEVGYPLDGFSITMNDLNFDAIDAEFVDWAWNEGFSGIATDIDLINMANASRSIEDCAGKLMEIRLACLSHGVENFGSWTTAYHNLVNGPDDGMPTFCKAVKGRNVSVNAEGNLFVCGHTTTCIGRLDAFDQAFSPDGDYAKLVWSRLPGNAPRCIGCEIEGVCAGQCHITQEVSRSTGNGRDQYLCDFYRLVTRRLLEEKLASEL